MSNSLSLIPQPKSLIQHDGHFTLDSNTQIFHNTSASASADYLSALLGLSIGKDVAESNNINLSCDDAADDESYNLTITPDRVDLSANGPRGLFHAVQTIKQLWLNSAKTLPCCTITDAPQFRWRGLMLDVARHMFPLEFIKRHLDMMALHKLNTFHWHLTEDQGWRIEIEKYPELVKTSAWRSETPIPADRDTGDGKPYGGFYTKDDVREVVAYAKTLNITVIPEIEMPGHTIAVLTAYPDLGCTGENYKVRTKWGIEDDVFCAGNDDVFDFLENVLTEVFELFDSEYIHIGGDECPKVRWEKCYKCQARMEEEELKDEHELQSYFVQRIEKFINANGRKMIGWDEILEGGLAPNASVMSWRGTEGGIAAAKAGHDVVMSPTSHCYLDYYQSEDKENEPPAIFGLITLEKAYEYSPVAGVPAEFQHHVMGGQGNLWSEYIPTNEQAEYMFWPRACALAERLWISAENANWQDFRNRINGHLKRFDKLGTNYRPLS